MPSFFIVLPIFTLKEKEHLWQKTLATDPRRLTIRYIRITKFLAILAVSKINKIPPLLCKLQLLEKKQKTERRKKNVECCCLLQMTWNLKMKKKNKSKTVWTLLAVSCKDSWYRFKLLLLRKDLFLWKVKDLGKSVMKNTQKFVLLS